VLLLLPIVGAIERFVLMKASTSASVTLFLRCKIREINLAAGKKRDLTSWKSATNFWRSAIHLALSCPVNNSPARYS
jgi:hypothetical protein